MLSCEHTQSYPVKNDRRGIADLFGVILLKRRRIADEVSTLWARQGRGMGKDGRFWTIYTYVYINICIRTIWRATMSSGISDQFPVDHKQKWCKCRIYESMWNIMGYITPIKLLATNFTSLVSRTQVSV